MQTIKSQSILLRADGIQKDLEKLRDLAKLSPSDFSLESNFVLAKYYLREALEGVFHIGSHILSRLPAGRATEYKEIAKKLGELGIVDKTFADAKLKDMAGYRNRLTHFYAQVTPEEVYRIIREDLGDFELYLAFIKNVLQHPEKFNLQVE